MNKVYCIKQGYVVREIAGECLAVPVDASSGAHIVILNPVSKFIWEKLAAPRTFDELLAEILNNYNVSEEEASSDLKEFLDQLAQSNILK